MVIDFSQVNFKERPTLILKNMDEKAIGALKHALNLHMDVHLGEVSEISFEYPYQSDGVIFSEYELLTGLRIIDVRGYGQFILRNPEETNDGVVRKKSCTAYSLEYEFNNDTITLEDGTYNFWNPVADSGSILSIILEKMPHWSIGTVSESLIGKYRTFNVDSKSIYDFMMSDLQQTYDCIFVFDTYDKTVSAISTSDLVPVNPVYLSNYNLIKEIQIEENTDDQTTVLDVYGADGVDIRSVNPMGENRLYNLDAYMNTSYFDQSIIDKWEAWKLAFANAQQPYFNGVMQMQMKVAQYATESAVLNELNGELTGLEAQLSVLIQLNAIDPSAQHEQDVANCQAAIAAKQTAIAAKETDIGNIQDEIASIQADLADINEATSLSAFFTDEELNVLRRYFKVGALTDSTFVAADYDSYSNESSTFDVGNTGSSLSITGSTVASVTDQTSGSIFYTVGGGTVTWAVDDDNDAETTEDVVTGEIVRGTIQVNTDDSFLASLYLNTGSVNGDTFTGGTLSLNGDASASSATDTAVSLTITGARVYLTREVTEYQKAAVAWELYEYAQNAMEKLAYPTYHFEVQSVDFLVLDEFYSFARNFKIGEKVYLHLNDEVLTPVVVGFSISFDDPTDFTIEFSDTFTTNQSNFSLESLLDKAVSMGHNLDLQQYNYSSFVNSGANTRVRQFMDSAIDTMRNSIVSGDGNQFTIDQAGLRARKYDPATGTYDDKQIWIANNAIMMTDDGWDTAKIGIGEFTDPNFSGTLYGIVAPLLAGTIITGNNLIIESETQVGQPTLFRVDGEGASLHNASFNLYGSSGGRIEIGTEVGIVAGDDKDKLLHYDSTTGAIDGVLAKDNSSRIEEVDDIDTSSNATTPNASFWIDMNGGAYFAGKILAQSGEIGGWTLAEDYLYSGSNDNYVALNASDTTNALYAIWAGAESPAQAPFWVKKDGTVNAKNGDFGNINVETVSSGGQTVTTTTIMNGSLSTGSGGYIYAGSTVSGHTYHKFEVTENGDVYIYGNLYMKSGSITWTDLDSSTRNTISNASSTAESLANGTYSGGTFIDGSSIAAPTIVGGVITGARINAGSGGFNLYYNAQSTNAMLHISYDGLGTVSFSSGAQANAFWSFGETEYRGKLIYSGATCNFAGATIQNLKVTINGTDYPVVAGS